MGSEFWVTFPYPDTCCHYPSLTLTVVPADTLPVTVSIRSADARFATTLTARTTEHVSVPAGVCSLLRPDSAMTRALYVTSSAPVSLYAALRSEDATAHEATAVLPVSSLGNHYRALPTGSHTLLALYDNTVIRYGNAPDQVTPPLRRGQVWYMPDPTHAPFNADILTDDGTPFALFVASDLVRRPRTATHANIFLEQAVPTDIWGREYVAVATAERYRDSLLVQALYDSTALLLNGDTVHVFDFRTNPTRTWRAEFGDEGADFRTEACYLVASCPVAVWQYTLSGDYDRPLNPTGAPALTRIAPLYSAVPELTVPTFFDGCHHYVNIVTHTRHVRSVRCNDSLIYRAFAPIYGTSEWSFARMNLDSVGAFHISADSTFCATVYGHSPALSYAFSAGMQPEPRTRAMLVNGIPTPAPPQMQCHAGPTDILCRTNYPVRSITWDAGDGTAPVTTTSLHNPHTYTAPGTYHATAYIWSTLPTDCSSDLHCDTLRYPVSIGRFRLHIDSVTLDPCPEQTDRRAVRLFFTDGSHTPFTRDSFLLAFNDLALRAGFSDDDLTLEDNALRLSIPPAATGGEDYGIRVTLFAECGSLDTTLLFSLRYPSEHVLLQRYTDVLGLSAEALDGRTVSDVQWYRNDAPIYGATNTVLNMQGLSAPDDTYHACFVLNADSPDERTVCTCPTRFTDGPSLPLFAPEDAALVPSYGTCGTTIFINTSAPSQARWYTPTGILLSTTDIPRPGGEIALPATPGIYLLSVSAPALPTRTFRIIVGP